MSPPAGRPVSAGIAPLAGPSRSRSDYEQVRCQT
ncbi:hypothetical protein [Amycolatopsis vancoresmycina]